jgi:hypothetical protein
MEGKTGGGVRVDEEEEGRVRLAGVEDRAAQLIAWKPPVQ